MTTLFAPTVNCARTFVTTPPSPAISGTTLVIPKIVLPIVTPVEVIARPFAETFRATLSPGTLEPATQANSEIIEVTAAKEIEIKAEKYWELTIVREVEGPMKARAIQPGDLFEVTITAGMLNPGPWLPCALGPKVIETAETQAIKPCPQIRWLSYLTGTIQMRGKVETTGEEIKKNTDVVIVIPEGFGGGSLQWTPRIPMFTKTWSAKLGEDPTESVVTMATQIVLRPITSGSREYASQVVIPGPSKVDLGFDSTFTGPWL